MIIGRVKQSMGLYDKDVKFGLQLGQIGPKWDKSGTFKDQFWLGEPKCTETDNKNVDAKFDIPSSFSLPS